VIDVSENLMREKNMTIEYQDFLRKREYAHGVMNHEQKVHQERSI